MHRVSHMGSGPSRPKEYYAKIARNGNERYMRHRREEVDTFYRGGANASRPGMRRYTAKIKQALNVLAAERPQRNVTEQAKYMRRVAAEASKFEFKMKAEESRRKGALWKQRLRG